MSMDVRSKRKNKNIKSNNAELVLIKYGPLPEMPKSKMARLTVISSGGFNLVFRLMVI